MQDLPLHKKCCLNQRVGKYHKSRRHFVQNLDLLCEALALIPWFCCSLCGGLELILNLIRYSKLAFF